MTIFRFFRHFLNFRKRLLIYVVIGDWGLARRGHQTWTRRHGDEAVEAVEEVIRVNSSPSSLSPSSPLGHSPTHASRHPTFGTPPGNGKPRKARLQVGEPLLSLIRLRRLRQSPVEEDSPLPTEAPCRGFPPTPLRGAPKPPVGGDFGGSPPL
ncbi:hypothetical protein QUB80_13520 [Chlorogloeopsis sp. ULAP01]|uniref:hypothetical protein n=1 Tax=Chlorogloeopsis sp. ULAP01 TaxID=3056483 RepID=UPI0025AAE557|nr:hypothetical protein [Chlorogloeopsis sp. ULAP01]MDM9381722.1 hypothetical protein [Chlorogloeopsis sp. ULAP01]